MATRTKTKPTSQQNAADSGGVFAEYVGRIGFEYDMLPKNCAQRHEYEKTWVTEWKHRLLTHNIAELKRDIAALQKELDALEPKHAAAVKRFHRIWNSNADRKTRIAAQEGYAPIGGRHNRLQSEIRRLSAYLAADERRYREGLDYGFEDVR